MLFNQDSYEAQAHAQVTGQHHARLSHEAIAAAASYEAAKAYENHLKMEGKPVNHQTAVQLLAGFAGGFVDRVFETKGLDALDRERIKHEAHKRAEAALAQSGAYSIPSVSGTTFHEML